MVALLSLLSAFTSAFAWEVDPTIGVVPLDRAAELYESGDVEGALVYLDQKMAGYADRYNELMASVDQSEERPFESLDRSLLRLNFATALYLSCYIKSGWQGHGDPMTDCSNPYDVTCYRWTDNVAPSYASGYIIDQLNGSSFGEGMGKADFSWQVYFGFLKTSEDDPSFVVACQIYFTVQRFNYARRVQNFLIDGRVAGARSVVEELLGPNSYYAWTRDMYPTEQKEFSLRQLCPWNHAGLDPLGAILASEAILALVDGDHEASLDAGLKALEGDVQTGYDDDFNHPLFWTMAAAHLAGRDDDKAALAETARSLRQAFEPEARKVIDFFIDHPASDDVSASCASVGCHYFAAQYLVGVGESGLANKELEAGAQYCGETKSVPCAAIREALVGDEAVAEP